MSKSGLLRPIFIQTMAKRHVNIEVKPGKVSGKGVIAFHRFNCTLNHNRTATLCPNKLEKALQKHVYNVFMVGHLKTYNR